MIRTMRRSLVLLAGALGLAVATASDAFAVAVLSNHTEPFTIISTN